MSEKRWGEVRVRIRTVRPVTRDLLSWVGPREPPVLPSFGREKVSMKDRTEDSGKGRCTDRKATSITDRKATGITDRKATEHSNHSVSSGSSPTPNDGRGPDRPRPPDGGCTDPEIEGEEEEEVHL